MYIIIIIRLGIKFDLTYQITSHHDSEIKGNMGNKNRKLQKRQEHKLR